MNGDLFPLSMVSRAYCTEKNQNAILALLSIQTQLAAGLVLVGYSAML